MERKDMSNFIIMIPKINSIWLWNIEKSTHTYTHSPSTCPALILSNLNTSVQWSSGQLGRKVQSHRQIKESWQDLSHFQSTLNIRGHTNTSEFKSKWFCWYHLYHPFTIRKKHVTSIKVQNTHSSNGSLVVATNNTQTNYASLHSITHKHMLNIK